MNFLPAKKLTLNRQTLANIDGGISFAQIEQEMTRLEKLKTLAAAGRNDVSIVYTHGNSCQSGPTGGTICQSTVQTSFWGC